MGFAKDFTNKDKFSLHNSMEVILAEKGHAKARCVIQSQHLNGLGTVHGGAIFTLADLAFAAASNADEDTVTGINVSMAYAKAAVEGATLFAEAREVTRSARLVTYEALVTNAAGEVIAVFQGTGYIKRKAA